MHFRRFLRARLELDSYLGLHLTLSLVLGAGAIWVSNALLDAVLDSATLVRLDLALAAYVQRHVNPVGIAVSRILSIVDSPLVMTIFGVLGASCSSCARARLCSRHGWRYSAADG